MIRISRISREIRFFGPMKASSSPGEILAGPGLPRISMTRRASLLLRRVIMVSRQSKFICQGRFSESLVTVHVTDPEICWAQDF